MFALSTYIVSWCFVNTLKMKWNLLNIGTKAIKGNILTRKCEMCRVRTVYIAKMSSFTSFTWMKPYTSVPSLGQYISHFLWNSYVTWYYNKLQFLVTHQKWNTCVFSHYFFFFFKSHELIHIFSRETNFIFTFNTTTSSPLNDS